MCIRDRSRDKLLTFTQRLEELRQGADEATRQIEQAALVVAERNAALAEERIRLSSARSSAAELQLRAGSIGESVLRSEARKKALEEEISELEEMRSDIEHTIEAQENAVKGYELRLDGRRKKAQAAGEELNRATLDANEQLRRAKLLEDLERDVYKRQGYPECKNIK